MKGYTIPTGTPALGGSGFMVQNARRFSPNLIMAGMMTAKEAAAYIGITRTALYQRHAAGIGPAVHRFRGQLLYKVADLDTYKAMRG